MNEPRFHVSTIEGYPISKYGNTGGNQQLVLVATVIDSLYGSKHGRFASSDQWYRFARGKPGGRWVPRVNRYGSTKTRGRAGALAAAQERCAELNAWHEREGWQPVPPLAEVVL